MGGIAVFYVIAGGILGTLGRWFLDGWIQSASGAGSFPLGTLLINITGSFALGFIARLGTGSIVISPELRAGLTVGLCGAFTTMSTFSYESVQLLGDGDYARAALYMGATILGCLAAVVAGTAAAGRLL